MQQNPRDIEYFSMTLNPAKERDRQAIDSLKRQPQKAKSDFVKNAIIAYNERSELHSMIGQIVRDVMTEEIPSLVCKAVREELPVLIFEAMQEVMRNHSAPLPAPDTQPEKIPTSAPQKKAAPAKPSETSSQTQKALRFMADLQASSE